LLSARFPLPIIALRAGSRSRRDADRPRQGLAYGVRFGARDSARRSLAWNQSGPPQIDAKAGYAVQL